MEFIHSNIAPYPASFRLGLYEKVMPSQQKQFANVVMGIIYSYDQATKEFVGTAIHDWNSKADIFLWLLFNV